MSRIGKQPIPIPANTSVTLAEGVLRVKGPHGEVSRHMHAGVVVSVKENVVTVSCAEGVDTASALWGTYASHIQNMVRGVNEKYMKRLEIEGVGYRANVNGQHLDLLVGFSHPVKVPIPQGITVSVEKNVIIIEGIDIELVGQFAANVRAVRPPEPYKGKGIRYSGEYIIRKQGKKSS